MKEVRCMRCGRVMRMGAAEAGMYFGGIGPWCSLGCLMGRIREAGRKPLDIVGGNNGDGKMNRWEETVKRFFDRVLTLPGEKVEYEPGRLRLTQQLGSETGHWAGKAYCPDFVIDPYNVVVEVKGQWGMHCGTAEKFQEVLRQYPENDFVLVTGTMVQRMARACMKKGEMEKR